MELARILSKKINAKSIMAPICSTLGVSRSFTTGAAAERLPFRVPEGSWLRDIGNTPVQQVEDGVFAKLEGCNPGGSIKARALTSIILNGFATGSLQTSGSTIVLVTSGWAGLATAKLHNELSTACGVDLNLIVVMPSRYAEKEIPAKLAKSEGVRRFDGGFDEYFSTDDVEAGGVNVVFEDHAFIDVLAKTHVVAKEKDWVVIDQHHNINGMYAHESTALELMQQVPGLTDVVCATGTGATAAGLRAYLPPSINVHSRPAVSGTIDGLTDVGRYNNFCDPTELVGYTEGDVLQMDDAVVHQQQLSEDHHIVAGPSSGATYWLARQVKSENADAKVAFICADGRSSRVLPTLEEQEEADAAVCFLSTIGDLPPVVTVEPEQMVA